MVVAMIETCPDPLIWITVISVTINVIGAVGWILESIRDRAQSFNKVVDKEATKEGSLEVKRIQVYRIVDLVLSQSLALYALVLLLWLPLLKNSFQSPSSEVTRYLVPAVCVTIGRHVFFCFRGWGRDRGAVPSVAHAVSAICQLLFLLTGTLLVFSAVAIITEIGNIYTHLVSIVGERRAVRLPSWVPGLGVVLSVIFNGLLYLVVMALALGRRSPMELMPMDVALFFFYITYSFIMNTYSIYLVIAAFFNSLVESRVRRAQARSGSGGTVPTQALANIRSALNASQRRDRPAEPHAVQETVVRTEETHETRPPTPDSPIATHKFHDDVALLVNNMV